MILYDSATLYDNNFNYEGGTIYSSVLTENLSITETKSNTIARILTDLVTNSDSLKKSISRLLSETITNTEILGRLAQYHRNFTENLSTSENLRKYLNGVEVIWDNIKKVTSIWTNKFNVWLYDNDNLYDNERTYDGNLNYTNQSKPTTGYTNKTKPSTNYSNKNKPSTNWNNIN
jgi:hypothetical protein